MPPAPKADIRKYAWFLFFLLTACYALVSFFRTSTSTLAVDIMRDFAVGGGLMSVMSSAFFYPYGFMQIPAGILSDRWGSRNTITLFMLLGAAGALLFALAPNVGLATTGRVIIGMGMGMVFVPSLRVFLRWFPMHQHVLITGLILSLGSGGMLLATWPLMKLTEFAGWRGSMLIAAALTVAMSIAVWIWARNTPEEKFGNDVVIHGRIPVSTTKKKPLPLRIVMASIVRKPAYWGISVWFFCIYGSFFAITSLWAGPYFIQGYGMSKDAAGGVLFFMALGAVLGPSLAGFIAQRGTFSKKFLLLLSCIISLVLGAPLLVPSPVLPEFILPAWALLFGIFCGGFGGIALAKVQDEFPSQIVGTATGMINIYCYIGTALLQLVSGCIMEWQAPGQSSYQLSQYAVMFMLFMTMFFCALVAVFFCLRSEEKKAPVPQPQRSDS